MYKYIESFNPAPFSALNPYRKFDVVKNIYGRYFVSIADGNTENADAIIGDSDGIKWINFNTKTNILQYWKPTLGLSTAISERVATFDFGGVTAPSNRDLWTDQAMSIIWDSLSEREYTSLIMFLEYRSDIGFWVTSRFGKTFLVLMEGFTKSRDNYNKNAIECSVVRTAFGQ